MNDASLAPDLAAGLFDLRGRTALVTGASAGIGLHAAWRLAQSGATVVLAARRKAQVEAAADKMRAAGHIALALSLDVTDPLQVRSAFSTIREELGTDADILVNNAGMLLAEKFLDQDLDSLEQVLATNLKGAFHVAQEAGRRMVQLGRGSIVHVASTAGLRAGSHMAAYAASKAGLLQLSKVMALELAGKGVRVNALCPGNIETDMQQTLADKGFAQALLRRTPMRRFGRVEDLDGPLLLLCSDPGRYMTGSVITVDGGQTLSWM